MPDRITIGAIAIAVVTVSAMVAGTKARAHVAPSGMTYSAECCHSAATSPTGDCAPIDAKYVKEGPDGYLIDLPVGSHPQLRTKGYSGRVPYDIVKESEDGQYHVCLSFDGGIRYCMYAPPRLG